MSKDSTKFLVYVGPIKVTWQDDPVTFRKLYLDTLQALLPSEDTPDNWAIVEELDRLFLEGDEPKELDVLEISTKTRDALSQVMAIRRQGLQGVCPPIMPERYNQIKSYWGMIATATPKRPRAARPPEDAEVPKETPTEAPAV